MKRSTVVHILRWFRNILFLLLIAESCLAFAFAAADESSCSTNSDTRQLDYWLGNWQVTYPGLPGSSNSKVELSLDKCVFVESWSNGEDHSGENLFAYSRDDKRWYGMFADNQGRVHVFTSGKVASGVAEFDGPSLDPNGEAVMNRVRIVRTGPDKVEQTWEKSLDSGQHWKTVFRGEYSRANP